MKNVLKIKRLGIDTYKEAVIYMRSDCHICRSEGFEAQARIALTSHDRTIIATLNIIHSEILSNNEAGLSEYAWQLLNAQEGDRISLSHPKPLDSLRFIRTKIFGHDLNEAAINLLIKDIVAGYLSDIQISAFITACAGGRLNKTETTYLTKAMVNSGSHLKWSSDLIVDKHCIGGLPGNRTTLIVVPIVAAFGLTIPKTSSRAITSPAGTADTMETLAPVDLSLKAMRKVIDQEGGCIIWGGAVTLSPADDMVIRVERSLNLDSDAQLVASVLSKKIAAGSTHVVVDVPIGESCKVRDQASALRLKNWLEEIGHDFGMTVRIIFTDGSQPVGRGIGPALEARDVLAVLQNHSDAPDDLKERALTLAGHILEFSSNIVAGSGKQIATEILSSGQAWQKFQAICEAQGGMRSLTHATHTHTITAKDSSRVIGINNRQVANIAKLAGAPQSKAAGIDLHVKTGVDVKKHEPLFTIHAETKGELEYALTCLKEGNEIFTMDIS